MGNLNKIFFGILQSDANDFMSSIIIASVFLAVLGFVGFMIVQICKRGSLMKSAQNVPLGDEDKILILDTKFLYGRKCLYLVRCSNRKILFLIDRERSCKLGEWVEDESNENNR